METTQQLTRRLEEVFFDGKWVANTNYSEQIRDLSWEKAFQNQGDLNSIASLLFHITYYIKGLVEAYNEGELSISDKYSFDMSEITPSEKSWNDMTSEFSTKASHLIDLVSEMTEEELDADFIKSEYGSNRRNIEGLIEHVYYHLGQIVITRKYSAHK